MAVPGSAGYSEAAETLAARYDGIGFEVAHAGALDLLPTPPARVLDIGAGSGRDAAHLATLGHCVTASEPTDEMRTMARRLHPEAVIDWRDDALPDLPGLSAGAARFDLILISAVWMHLDAAERASAMPVVARLLAPAGRLILTLRHGPVPKGRRMFGVDPAETEVQAASAGLGLVRRRDEAPKQAPNWLAGVRWTRLVFERPD